MQTVKTAVIGASGFVGRQLWNSLREVFPDCVGTAWSRPQAGLIPWDLRKPDLASLRLVETGHQAVLVAAAVARVDECARDPLSAAEVNVAGTIELARQARRLGIRTIFLSSDYVFPGVGGPYDDDHPTAPTTEYGRQKETAERELLALADDTLIIRLSKVFGVQRGDGTLLDEMAAKLAAGEEIAAAVDQQFCPTLVDDVVHGIQLLLGLGIHGRINLCSPESFARYEIACAVADAISVGRSQVRGISLGELTTLAPRPLDTRMKCSRLSALTRMEFTPLKESIARIAAAYR